MLSRLCQWAQDVLGKDTYLVLRYIGLTSASCTVYDVLWSICTQLSWIMELDTNISMYTESRLVHYFYSLLFEVGKMNNHLLIVLDGLEQLRIPNPHSGLNLEWLMENMPSNVHIFVSFSPTQQSTVEIFQHLKSKIKPKSHHLHPPKLQDFHARNQLIARLNKTKRKITSEQEKVFIHCFKFEPTALFLELCIEEAVTWESSFQINAVCRPKSLDALVQSKFDRLEKKYGYEMISQIARYFISCWHGLTEMELMDILSCNNTLLLKVFLVSLPPILRFPFYLWSELRQELGCLLVEQHTDNKTLLVWSHSCMQHIAGQRYR